MTHCFHQLKACELTINLIHQKSTKNSIFFFDRYSTKNSILSHSEETKRLSLITMYHHDNKYLLYDVK